MVKFFLSLLLIFPASLQAQLKLAAIFSNNMVLQRDQPIHIWGKGMPGQQINIFFAKEKRQIIVTQDSTWSVYFKKQKANSQPQSVMISGDNKKIELENILIGDLWLCIGQSNMEFPMQQEMHYRQELRNADQPLLRFYNPSYAGKNIFAKAFSDSVVQRLNVNDFFKGEWQTSDSVSIKNMSAVGYYFGKEIIDSVHVPVGLIHLGIGGAPIETFISRDAMQNNQQFVGKVKGNWLANDALPVWVRQRGKENTEGKTNVPKDGLGPNHAFKPGFAYETGIAPIVGLPIKGILWYQGESNAQEIERVNEYGQLQQLMINDYRNKWKQPDMPFYWVQLSSIDTAIYKSQLWPEFRNEQRKVLSEVKNGGMAVSSDAGAKDNIHPANKKTVGERLARWALNKTYHKNVLPSGPLPVEANYANGEITVSFEYTGKGLQAADGKAVRGFSTDGKTETEVTIQNKTVIIVVNEKPEFVYYAWQPFTDADLVNSELLPASTFKIKVE